MERWGRSGDEGERSMEQREGCRLCGPMAGRLALTAAEVAEGFQGVHLCTACRARWQAKLTAAILRRMAACLRPGATVASRYLPLTHHAFTTEAYYRQEGARFPWPADEAWNVLGWRTMRAFLGEEPIVLVPMDHPALVPPDSLPAGWTRIEGPEADTASRWLADHPGQSAASPAREGGVAMPHSENSDKPLRYARGRPVHMMATSALHVLDGEEPWTCDAGAWIQGADGVLRAECPHFQYIHGVRPAPHTEG